MAHCYRACVGSQLDGIDDDLRMWLLQQPVFFVATAPIDADGHVNCSPKGLVGTFAVLGEHRVAYLDLTGSGVETIAHVRENGRIVLMFCAFVGKPRIVRLHGRAQVCLRDTQPYAALAPAFGDFVGARSIIEVTVERISDSCGFGVPTMSYVADRRTLVATHDSDGAEAVAAYWATHNQRSIDGLPALDA